MSKNHQENLAYFTGDTFQFWIGPSLPQSTPDYSAKMAELQKIFQSANVLAECCGNWKDGLLSEPFTWNLKDKQGKRVEAKQAEITLQRWLDFVKRQAIAAPPESTNFKQADPWAEFALSLGVIGQGNLRLWQPLKFANDPDPIKRIHLHSPKAGSVVEERDEDGFLQSISYSYGTNKKEIQRLTESGELEVVVEIGGQASGEPLRIDTGGEFLMLQLRSPSLLSPSIKGLQNSINHALTMKLKNNEIAGFRERVFINAAPPGEWIDDPEIPGRSKFLPADDIERGAGIDQYIYGTEQGDSLLTTPSIHETEPINPENFKRSIEIDRLFLYLEMRQGHLLASADGALSGESRIQMRQAFELYLRGWQARIESAIASILNIVLKILGYGDLEAVVSLNITTGKLSPEERSGLLNEVNSDLLSRSTAMAKLGTVDDVDAELILMKEEQAEQMAAAPVIHIAPGEPPTTPPAPAPAPGEPPAGGGEDEQ